MKKKSQSKQIQQVQPKFEDPSVDSEEEDEFTSRS